MPNLQVIHHLIFICGKRDIFKPLCTIFHQLDNNLALEIIYHLIFICGKRDIFKPLCTIFDFHLWEEGIFLASLYNYVGFHLLHQRDNNLALEIIYHLITTLR